MKSISERPDRPPPEAPLAAESPAAEQVLDFLLDALEQRRVARQDRERSVGEQWEEDLEPAEAISTGGPAREQEEPPAPSSLATTTSQEEDLDNGVREPPPQLINVNLTRMLGRLLLVVAALVVLVNIPINRHGTPLARIMPDSAALVIRDGLVLKAQGPEIYVLQDDKLRWISSLEAFEYFGYTWPQVRQVDEAFLDKFEIGRPIHVLLKCRGNPHIYALEDGRKRWIKDIATFETEGFVWEDVKTVDCLYLDGLPDGIPIPSDAGSPP